MAAMLVGLLVAVAAVGGLTAALTRGDYSMV